MKSVFLQSIGIVAPGIANWPDCRDILNADKTYKSEPIPRFIPDTLPVNERRRVTSTIRLAMQSATEAIQESTYSPKEVATVFVTSDGDMDISDRICNALTLQERPVSPTDFHNSIHNAPAGYWGIGSQCRLPSTSLSAGCASFAVGLLESVTQIFNENHPVMLVAYNQPSPEIFAMGQTVTIPFSVALLITQHKTKHSMGEMKVAPVTRQGNTRLDTKALETLIIANPAAQALLLLELVAKRSIASCVLPYHDAGGLLVEYSPCR